MHRVKQDLGVCWFGKCISTAYVLQLQNPKQLGIKKRALQRGEACGQGLGCLRGFRVPALKSRQTLGQSRNCRPAPTPRLFSWQGALGGCGAFKGLGLGLGSFSDLTCSAWLQDFAFGASPKLTVAVARYCRIQGMSTSRWCSCRACRHCRHLSHF